MEITTTQLYELLFIEHHHHTRPLVKAVTDEYTFRTALVAELGLTEARAVTLPILSIRINKIPSTYLFIVKSADPSLISKIDKSVEIQFPDITFSIPQRSITENQNGYSYFADILRYQIQSAETTYTYDEPSCFATIIQHIHRYLIETTTFAGQGKMKAITIKLALQLLIQHIENKDRKSSTESHILYQKHISQLLKATDDDIIAGFTEEGLI